LSWSWQTLQQNNDSVSYISHYSFLCSRIVVTLKAMHKKCILYNIQQYNSRC
jgi:hypothetical protein